MVLLGTYMKTLIYMGVGDPGRYAWGEGQEQLEPCLELGDSCL